MAKKSKGFSTSPLLEGKTFVLVGKAFRAIQDAGTFVKKEGASIANELGPKVDFVIVPQRGGDTEAANVRKAVRQQNRKGARVKVITPGEIHGTLQLSANDVVAMLQAGKPGVARFRALIHASFRLSDEDIPPKFKFDLSRRDLRGISVPSTNLTCLNLDEADLSGATLRNSKLPPLRSAQLQNADLFNCRLHTTKNCNFDGAKLNQMRLGLGRHTIEGCSFNGATLTRAGLPLRRLKKCSFRSALIRRADLEKMEAASSDFTQAILDESNCSEANLSRAKLVQAKLKRTNLGRANLQGADLTGAELRGAYLVGANLTKCKVAGADFRNANLFAAKFDGVDITKAKGLDAVPQPTGEIGPRTQEFAQFTGQFKRVSTSVKVRLPGGETPKLMLHISEGASAQIELDAGKPAVLNTRGRQICSTESVEQAMIEVAPAVGWGTLLPETVDATSEESPIDRESLTRLARSAWCEVFGVQEAKQTDIKKHKQKQEKKVQQLQQKLLKSLRETTPGIDRMEKITHDNVHLIHERMEVILGQIQEIYSLLGQNAQLDLREVDLSKANLVGVSFYRMNLEGASLRDSFGGGFDHVNLTAADLRSARVGEAAYADLTKADLRDADLHETCFLGANLNGANLAGANLCGADLRNIEAEGVAWKKATFDAKTRFSPDFDLPTELVWVGAGKDPRAKGARNAAHRTKRKSKKVKTASTRSQKARKSQKPADLSLRCLFTDKQLAKACDGLADDPALPDGMEVEDLRHPIYGQDHCFSIALEYCPNRFRDFNLSQVEFDFNTWYRAERFVQLFDAAESCYSDGDHDRAERLMPQMTGEVFEKVYRRIQREVRKILSGK